MDDIFSGTNDQPFGLGEYQTPIEILKEQPFSGYLQMFGYSLGVSTNEILAVKSILDKAEIKKLKPVEPYKAKGIKEKGQYVLRKEGKKK